MTENPKPPSPLSLILSGLMVLYLLWAIFIGTGEAPSSTLYGLYWVLLVMNLIFLGMSFMARRK